MDQDILFQGKNPEGKIFTLYGNKAQLKLWASQFLDWKPNTDETEDDDDYEDYSLNYCDKDGHGGRFTLEEREADIADLRTIVESIDTAGFMSHFIKLPRKKNNSLAKGRVVTLWRGYTFQHYWEDSYGFNAPELSLKSTDDYKAVLELTSRTVGY